ncbi:MAG: hypothetical protein LBP76_09430 [Treponema sp.]|jgi:hypothetical protein|nr:hypothetical protein [Treponema sp.]
MSIKLTTPDPLLKAAVFAPMGWTMRRNNYDGTAVRPTRNLTWNVPVNLSEDLNEGKYPIQIGLKGYIITAVDGDGPIEWEIDLSGAADISAVTPAEMAVALNGAVRADDGTPITDWQAVVDAVNGACNWRCTKPGAKFAQIFGVLAGAMGFGGGHAYTNYGTEFVDTIKDDDTITTTPTLSRTENTNVDQTGSQNGLTRIVVQGETTGVAYALNIKPLAYRLRQIVEGGKLVVHEDGVHYEPPRSGVSFDKGNINCEMFKIDPTYPANSESTKGNEDGYIVNHCYRGSAQVNDETSGAMTLTAYNYTYTAGIYIDEQGRRFPQPEEIRKTLSQWSEYGLKEASQNNLSLNMFDVIPMTGATLTASLTLTAGQAGSNPVVIDPDNANNFNVSFDALTTLTDTVLSWNDDADRIDIAAGNITGTETVTVTFTNRNGTAIVKTFSLTVS